MSDSPRSAHSLARTLLDEAAGNEVASVGLFGGVEAIAPSYFGRSARPQPNTRDQGDNKAGVAIMPYLTRSVSSDTVLSMMNMAEFNKRFPNEEACREYLVSMRWPNGPTCPRCSAPDPSRVKGRWAWQCRKCSPNGYRFSPLVGTIFENTNYALQTWFSVIFLMCQSKKGVSALQVHRMIGSGSYRTAWYMCHRIRAAMNNGTFQKLTGKVEVDETYIGGRSGNRHASKRSGRVAHKEKVADVGALARKGSVVARVIEKADQPTLNAFVDESVSFKVKLVATDEWPGYNALLSQGVPHETVSHQKGEYVRGQVHTANLDSFWSLLKRGIMGSFHQVSKAYLPFYLAELTCRHNNPRNANMFDLVVAQC